MISTISPKFPQSPIYKQAIEIFSLSRSISHCIGDDLCGLSETGKEDNNIYFTGDIIQQSVSLAPEILKAESQLFSEDKYRYAASVSRLTNLLYKNCERLEQSNSNGTEFIQLLRTELKKFRKLQRNWMLTL